jgi:hypothetical protein
MEPWKHSVSSAAATGGSAWPRGCALGSQIAGPKAEQRSSTVATKVTNSGVGALIDLIDQTIGTNPKYVGWGTGAGTAAITDTTLFTEASETRVAGAESQVTTTVTGDTYRTVATLTADAGKTITNAGTFVAVSGGAPVVKGDFAGVALLTGDQITFTCNLQLTTS